MIDCTVKVLHLRQSGEFNHLREREENVEQGNDWVSQHYEKCEQDLVDYTLLVPAQKVLVELRNDCLLRMRVSYELKRTTGAKTMYKLYKKNIGNEDEL